MTRKSKKYQLLVSALLLCFLQVAGIDVYAQSTVTPARKDTTIIQREAPKARARRHRDPIIGLGKEGFYPNHTIQRTSGHRQFVSC